MPDFVTQTPTRLSLSIQINFKDLPILYLKQEHFDFSGCWNKNHPLYHHLEEKKKQMSNDEFEEYMNYGTPGKLKNENKWFSIEEFVVLRPKQYSYITEDDEANKIFKKEGLLTLIVVAVPNGTN